MRNIAVLLNRAVSSRRATFALILAIGLTPGVCLAQRAQMSPQDMMRRVAANEIKANNQPSKFIYKDCTEYKNRSICKQVIETDQGNLGRTVWQNGKPLTPEEQAKEDRRLEKFAHDPNERRKKQQSDKEDDERAAIMLKSLPDAFVYTYAGNQKSPNGEEMIRLTFQPNPGFRPPNHETEVYLGMNGDVLVDAKAMRIAKLDGTLFRDVNFGWGILGRLYSGGRFVIEQRDIGGGRWELTKEMLQFNGKILMIKPLTIWSTETATDFHPVPPKLTTAQALNLLYKGNEVVAENGGAAADSDAHNKHK